MRRRAANSGLGKGGIERRPPVALRAIPLQQMVVRGISFSDSLISDECRSFCYSGRYRGPPDELNRKT